MGMSLWQDGVLLTYERRKDISGEGTGKGKRQNKAKRCQCFVIGMDFLTYDWL